MCMSRILNICESQSFSYVIVSSEWSKAFLVFLITISLQLQHRKHFEYLIFKNYNLSGFFLLDKEGPVVQTVAHAKNESPF